MAAAAAVEALTPFAGAEWSVPAGSLEWSCRATLDHIADCLFFYAAHLSTRAQQRRPFSRDGDPRASVEDILCVLDASAAILSDCIRAAPADVRAYHPYGNADPAGFAAMACDEILVHANDIASGLGLSFEPPRPVCERTLARLFPLAPREADPWTALLWANGRGDLRGHERVGPKWMWHAAPLGDDDDGMMPV